MEPVVIISKVVISFLWDLVEILRPLALISSAWHRFCRKANSNAFLDKAHLNNKGAGCQVNPQALMEASHNHKGDSNSLRSLVLLGQSVALLLHHLLLVGLKSLVLLLLWVALTSQLPLVVHLEPQCLAVPCQPQVLLVETLLPMVVLEAWALAVGSCPAWADFLREHLVVCLTRACPMPTASSK